MDGFDAEGVAPERWRPLAERKLAEVEASIARAEGVRRLLADSLRCDCETLDACGLVHAAARPGQRLPVGSDQRGSADIDAMC